VAKKGPRVFLVGLVVYGMSEQARRSSKCRKTRSVVDTQASRRMHSCTREFPTQLEELAQIRRRTCLLKSPACFTGCPVGHFYTLSVAERLLLANKPTRGGIKHCVIPLHLMIEGATALTSMPLLTFSLCRHCLSCRVVWKMIALVFYVVVRQFS